jgi:hypothetical protein
MIKPSVEVLLVYCEQMTKDGIGNCHTAIENLSDPIGYLLDFTNISYIGFRQVIRAHITCLCFIFPEPKAREIYNSDRLYEPVLHV